MGAILEPLLAILVIVVPIRLAYAIFSCKRASRLAMIGKYLELHAMICCKKERNYPVP